MATHHLANERSSFQGSLSSQHAPVLIIEDGDSVICSIPDAGWSMEGYNADGERNLVFPELDPSLGHCLAGPIAVAGAKPGMVLEVVVEELITSDWGWTAVGWPGELNEVLGLVQDPPRIVRWNIDTSSNTAESDFGYQTKINPFLGFMGLAFKRPGEFCTISPSHLGGNLDCRELTVGSSLFLHIEAPQALFYCGDCHAAQGDGELCGTAMECAAERAKLRFVLHDSMPTLTTPPWLPQPVARVKNGWIAFGLHPELETAMAIAADAVIRLIQKQLDVSQAEAAAVASVSVDFRITQTVNGVKGVHAFWSL